MPEKYELNAGSNHTSSEKKRVQITARSSQEQPEATFYNFVKEIVAQAIGIPIFDEEFVPQAIEISIFVNELGFQVQGPRHCFGTLKNGPGDQVYANGPKSSRKHPKSDHFPRARRHPPETWFLGSRQGLSQEAFQKRENTARNSQEQPRE